MKSRATHDKKNVDVRSRRKKPQYIHIKISLTFEFKIVMNR